ncbi:MAG: alpha/beta hydrolase [Pseudomonadota bacterium]
MGHFACEQAPLPSIRVPKRPTHRHTLSPDDWFDRDHLNMIAMPMRSNRIRYTLTNHRILAPMNNSQSAAHSSSNRTARQMVSCRCPAWGEEILLQSNVRPSPLHLRLLCPPEPSTASAGLLIVHGMNEYIGHYRDIASFFAPDFIVGGMDLCAHGLTNPTLFDADRAIANGAEASDVSDAFLAQSELRDLGPMRADLDQALRHLIERLDAEQTTETANKRPVIILAHSLGGLVAASYLLETTGDDDPRGRVAGVVLCGPAFSVPELPISGIKGKLQNGLIRFSFEAHELGSRPWSGLQAARAGKQAGAFLAALLIDGIFKLLSLPGLRRIFTPTTPDWIVDTLTDWPEERARHRADNYIIRRTLLTFVTAVEREIIAFRRRMIHFDVPYLLIYSGKDPITPAWGNLDFAALTRDRHPDNQVIPLQDKSHHEHLFSAPPLREELLISIGEWMKQRVGRSDVKRR